MNTQLRLLARTLLLMNCCTLVGFASVAQDSAFNLFHQSIQVDFIVGDSGDENVGYLLSQTKEIRLDSKNNIYLSDRSSNSILVFNDHGEFVRTIGDLENEIPGGIEEVFSFAIDSTDVVWLYDRHQQQMSRFSSTGYLGTSSLSDDRFIAPKQFEVVGNNIVYLNGSVRGDYVVNCLGIESKLQTCEVLEKSLVYGSPEQLEWMLEAAAYVQLARVDHGLIVAKEYYEGSIWGIGAARNESQISTRTCNTIAGQMGFNEPYKSLRWADYFSAPGVNRSGIKFPVSSLSFNHQDEGLMFYEKVVVLKGIVNANGQTLMFYEINDSDQRTKYLAVDSFSSSGPGSCTSSVIAQYEVGDGVYAVGGNSSVIVVSYMKDGLPLLASIHLPSEY